MKMNCEEIIKKMNRDEKIALLTGKDSWHTVSLDRLGIPSIAVSDGPHGLRKIGTDANGKEFTYKATCFPTASAMSATWNTELVRKVGEAIGEECGAMDVDVILGPGTNIKRTPLCGRNFEYFSEDPYLAGEMSAAFIDGVQSRNVGTSLKHFAANNQEYDRFQINADIDIRTLREIYLKPFEIAVRKAKPWTVMCAYNRLNGIYCSENKFLLNDILREEWGFDGIVVSDWGAVHDRAKSLLASLELEMPFSAKSADNLKKALDAGVITENEIDNAVRKLLDFIFKAIESRKKRTKSYDTSEHHRLAKEAALEAITLLKNDEGILPINSKKVRKIAVIGRLAQEPAIQGEGSSHVEANLTDKPLDKILELAGNDIEVEYQPAYHTWDTGIGGLNKAMDAAMNSQMAVVFVGNRRGVEGEGFDRQSIRLSREMEDVILRIAECNPNTVVVVQAGSAIDMSSWIGRVKAVVFTWFAGQAAGSAIADILFGVSNPCGKIAETFPCSLEDTPAYGTYPGNGYVSRYAEGIMVGYRYYDTYKKDVLFPFGHGLSYTSFEYGDLKIVPEAASEWDRVEVSFKIKNTGNMAGKETAQLYVRDVSSKVLRPEKELKAFCKIDLKPGEEKEVKLTLRRDAFAYFNTSLNSWHVESGKFDILIGASSRDIRLSGSVFIKSENDFT